MSQRDAEPADDDADAAWAEPFAAERDDGVQHSLFGEILDWMLAPLLLLWPMSIAITYLVAKAIANQPFDHALEDSVTVLAQQVREVDGKLVKRLPGSARDMLRADDVDSVYFLILGRRGEYVDGDRDLAPPLDEDRFRSGRVLFRNDSMHGTPIRVAFTYLDLADAGADEPRRALVQVAETLDKRAHLANEIIKGVILPQFIILPIVLALVWFALARGLSPLAQLQERIRARAPDDLSPIEPGQVPEEISPLVGSLNDMLARLSLSIEMQKRFIADAAHQMKTPLAGMRMQSELALRQTDQREIHRSLQQLAKSSEAATRLVNQLLALARAENQPQAGAPFERVELNALARDAVRDWVPASFKLRIDLGFEEADGPAGIAGNAIMLRELLSNLIDNALRYTPAGGSVTVRVRRDGAAGRALLEVEDTGPGIAAAERGRVFERFYRILGSNADGSGLGLAIVREIAQQHGADVEVLSNPRGRPPTWPGCLFRLGFAPQGEDAPADTESKHG
ncbi:MULTISPECIES: sensor histidine kinase N-terminal domain-containing protein [unclassified Janthinobacterium]|uniref:sensor histidine kinase N-terminal domain-containing protein n=1 Tax=unclassified Janthinobacterium TaxID=2610881 RepID=UPI00034CA5EC|nr:MULTISPECIES: sensor histidine kinase N-terminal domain-containing protein [unclassified Janthinobacterium]MEC5161582.1 two-component system sensor histidine kinase TctE [Janthinobacterium sp. CG_S6]